MGIIAIEKRTEKAQVPTSARVWSLIISWLTTWELYPILAVAFFLHFYQLTTTQFDADQAIMARMPRAAVVHGLIPATGTISSIGMINPPGYFWLMMLVAVLTANPFANVIFTALLNIAAVILTYAFTRRYYGRLAGTIAALLYATTFEAVFFGRFIWQPNLLPFFTLLFLWALFRGAIEQKPGWFALAFPILGFMLQLHATPSYMFIPLIITLILAYKTVRKRDLILGVLFFLLMFSTYFIWEASTHFADVPILLGASGGQVHIDTLAFRYYEDFFAPYVTLPTNPVIMPTGSQSLLLHLMRLLHVERWAMYGVVLGGFLVAILGFCGWKHIQLMDSKQFPEDDTAPSAGKTLSFQQKMRREWKALVASPQRRSLLLLLAWQVPPLLLLSRHTIALQPHYFLILLPGPFILVGLLFKQLAAWGEQIKDLRRLARYAVPTIAILMIVLQGTGSFAWFFDESQGAIFHGNTYDTWQGVQGAVNAADQLAQTRHIHHVYIYTDEYTFETFRYLSWQMHTPATILSASNCLILPSLSQGPAVLLLGPADTLEEALVKHFASATLVSEPPRLGGAPFHLYMVQPLSAVPQNQESFVHTLALDKNQPGSFSWSDPAQQHQSARHILETSWTNLSSLPAREGTMYTYHFDAQYSGHSTDNTSTDCTFSSLTPGEQVLVPFNLPAGSTVLSGSLSLTGSIWIDQPETLNYGPFHFESILDTQHQLAPFQGVSGSNNLIIQNESSH